MAQASPALDIGIKPAILVTRMPQQLEVRNDEDDWTGITSSAKRRKLQNRLNQRTYRNRKKQGLSGQPGQPGQPGSHGHATTRAAAVGTLPPDTPSTHAAVSLVQAQLVLGACCGSDQSQTTPSPPPALTSGSDDDDDPAAAASAAHRLVRNPRVQQALHHFAGHAYWSYVNNQPQLSHLSFLVQFNVLGALARNASLLGVSALWLDYDAVSPFNKQGPGLGIEYYRPPQASDLPATLTPTPLQGTLEHHPWIDLFPLPRMRDNFLRAILDPDVCDEDDLCRDLCQLGDPADKATLIVWGSPWDPRSWEASVPFLRKWGWLLRGCDDVLEATNYWRLRRGESRLQFAGLTDEGAA